MKFSKEIAGALIVPVIAIAYAIHAIWELNAGEFRDVTLTYTYAIATPVLILAAIIIYRSVTQGDSPTNIGGDTELEQATVVWKGRGKRLISVVGLTFILIATMEEVGYVFGFFLYVTLVMWVMDIRKFKPILIVATIMTAIVHFIFADILDQDLPQGILEPFFDWLEDD
jgi:hypothetical protein